MAQYAIWLHSHVHCDAPSIFDVEIETYEYRATLWLGLMGAGMLQLLGVILFWTGRARRNPG